jgi:hypothetical protein
MEKVLEPNLAMMQADKQLYIYFGRVASVCVLRGSKGCWRG